MQLHCSLINQLQNCNLCQIVVVQISTQQWSRVVHKNVTRHNASLNILLPTPRQMMLRCLHYLCLYFSTQMCCDNTAYASLRGIKHLMSCWYWKIINLRMVTVTPSRHPVVSSFPITAQHSFIPINFIELTLSRHEKLR